MRFDGKWEQTCSNCGVTEAAGYYCTKCFSATQKEWLHRKVVSESSLRALAASRPLRGAHRAS